MVNKEKSHKERVLGKLKRDRYITRNECLDNRITRLASIIDLLKKHGYTFEKGKSEVVRGRKDFIYRLETAPTRTVKVVDRIENGTAYTKEVQQELFK